MKLIEQKNAASYTGDWSDKIVVRERVSDALSICAAAVLESADCDPCAPDVLVAVDFICARIARGSIMAASWRKGGAVVDHGLRRQALDQVLRNMKSGVGQVVLD